MSSAGSILGLAVRINREWVKKAISEMKSDKAPGPPGIVVEMSKASGEIGIYLVTELVNSIVNEGVVPADWEISSIAYSYKGKGNALGRGNFRASQ